MTEGPLFRYQESVPIGLVPPILTSDLEPAVEPVIGKVDDAAYKRFIDTADLAASENPKSTRLDADLAIAIHRTLRAFDSRDLTDARFWQWLTTVPHRDYVINRWAPECVDDPDQAGRSSTHQRFCGAGSIGGTARNALARLYWVADGTVVDDDYTLTKEAFGNTDLLVGVFERRLGLEPRLSRACIRHLSGAGQAVHRLTLKIVNYSLSTVVIEALEDADVDRLVLDSLDKAKIS
jgi:hypothetical protein